MPKQKIEVNEDLSVSIRDLLKPNATDNLSSKMVTNNKMATNSKTATEPPITNAPRDPDIKDMIPEFGKISIQHQRAGRGGKTVTLIFISGKAEHKLKQNLEALLKELKKSLA